MCPPVVGTANSLNTEVETHYVSNKRTHRPAPTGLCSLKGQSYPTILGICLRLQRTTPANGDLGKHIGSPMRQRTTTKETRTSGMRQHPCLVRAFAFLRFNHRAPSWMHGGVRGRFLDQWAVSCLRRAGKQSVGEILFRDRFQGFPGSFHRFFCGFYYGVGHFFGLFDHMLHSLLDGFGGVGQVLPRRSRCDDSRSDPAGPAALTGICLHNGQ